MNDKGEPSVKIEVDLDEVALSEIKKRDRKIGRLENEVQRLSDEVAKLKGTLKAINEARDAIIAAADWLEPHRYCDD